MYDYLDLIGGIVTEQGIGSRIKELRVETGLSQADFGEKIGITGDQVGKIENGSRRPSEEAMVQIKGQFNTSIDYLYTGDTDIMPRLPENMNINLHTPMAKMALQELNKINSCSNTIAQSIKSLDCVAVVGMEYLERERKKFDKNPEVEKMIRLVKMEGRVAN